MTDLGRVITPGEAARTLREHLHEVLVERYGTTVGLHLTAEQSEDAIREARARAGAGGKPTVSAETRSTTAIRGITGSAVRVDDGLDTILAEFSSVDADPDPDSARAHILGVRQLGATYTADEYVAAVEEAQALLARPDVVRAEAAADVDLLERSLVRAEIVDRIAADRLGANFDEGEYLAELERVMGEIDAYERSEP